MTPVFVMSRVPRGPTINLDVEDPIAKRHKKIVNNKQKRGRVVMELRNENSEVEGHQFSQYSDDE
jgi:hypothetical protein